MHSDLRENTELLIVSDTAFYETPDGFAVFEPTLREVEHLLEIFSKITWIGAHHGHKVPGNARLVKKKGIHFIPISRSGGEGFRKKLGILWHAPGSLLTIWKAIRKHKFIHTRAPATPAFLAALLNHLYPNKRFWHKYAGNWAQENAPRGYTIQRWLLRHTGKSMVTVNGKWEKDPGHVYAFENPCLSEEELNKAGAVAAAKSYHPPYRMLFAGRVEEEKGVGTILRALAQLNPNDFPLEELVIAGTGKDEAELKAEAFKIPFRISFKGALSRKELEEEYRKAQFFIFPSTASEGFPKVVSEAASYGCILVTSPVSSLVQYIHHNKTGLVIDPVTPDKLRDLFRELGSGQYDLPQIAAGSMQMAPLFTYERYNRRIKSLFTDGEAF